MPDSVLLSVPLRRRWGRVRRVRVRPPTITDMAALREVWGSDVDAWGQSFALIQRLTALSPADISALAPVDFVTLAEAAGDAVERAVALIEEAN